MFTENGAYSSANFHHRTWRNVEGLLPINKSCKIMPCAASPLTLLWESSIIAPIPLGFRGPAPKIPKFGCGGLISHGAEQEVYGNKCNITKLTSGAPPYA